MRPALFGFIAAVLISGASGCSGIFGGGEPVILSVSEIDAPQTIPPGASLSITLTVETGGCRRFDHIETQRAPSGANVIVWGHDGAAGRKNVACTTDIRYDDHLVRFDPPFGSTFAVSVSRGRMPPHTFTVRIE